jgi:hypothetical protein
MLMELGISRDRLHHILDADNDQYLVGAGKDLAKVRTTSHMGPSGRGRPASPFRQVVYIIRRPPAWREKKEGKRCAVMRRTLRMVSKWW